MVTMQKNKVLGSSKLAINPRLLLAIYAVMPLSLLFIGFDTFFLGGRVGNNLPVDPRIYIWFVLIFMVPHIFASFFSFADKEYIHHYKPKLLRGAQIAVILGIFLPALTGATLLPVMAFAIYTMMHVFMQQSGISKSLMRNTTKVHAYWQWLGIAMSTCIYAYLLVPTPWFQGVFRQSTYSAPIIVATLTIYCLLGLYIFRHSRTKIGEAYFLATHCMPIIGLLFIVTGYPILALVIPRIIHDLTAYTFYITHDSNRYTVVQSNLLYRATSLLKLPVYIASPVVSILLSIVVARLNSGTMVVILVCIFFLHYYMESVIWKKDTLHRMNITFST